MRIKIWMLPWIYICLKHRRVKLLILLVGILSIFQIIIVHSHNQKSPDKPIEVTEATTTSLVMSNKSTKINHTKGSHRRLHYKVDFSTGVKKSTITTEKTPKESIRVANNAHNFDKFQDKLHSIGYKIDKPSFAKLSKSCSTNKKKPYHLYNLLDYPFIHNEPYICQQAAIYLLLVVHSNVKNFKRRSTIRKTWGSVRYVGKYRISLLFFVGSDSDNTQIQQSLDKESNTYRDIIQRNFQENYKNMTLKHLTIYEWISQYCQNAQFITKVDDDTFVDIFHLVTFLMTTPPDGFYCSKTTGAKPKRATKNNIQSKWVVSVKEYRWKMYPPYCEGLGYVLATKYVVDLYVCSMFAEYFWIDDVFVGGVLPYRSGVSLAKFWPGHAYAAMLPSYASAKIMDVVFLTAYHSEFIEGMWHKLWQAAMRFSYDPGI